MFILFLLVPPCQVVRAGLNVDIAPDLIANQLNVRYGALILQVSCGSRVASQLVIYYMLHVSCVHIHSLIARLLQCF